DCDVNRHAAGSREAPPVRGAAVAENRSLAVSQDRREHASLRRYCSVTEGVHPTKDAIKAARSEPVSDRAVRHAEPQELAPADPPALVGGDFSRPNQSWLIERLIVSS